jgi:hypothetical protein
MSYNADAVRHLMWVEWQDADSIPSHTGRNKLLTVFSTHILSLTGPSYC